MTDSLGWRKKIGVVIPAVNTIVQPECDDMRPDGVTNHVERIVTPNARVASDDAFLKHVENMRAGIMDAIDRILPSAPDFLIMGLSLEAFWEGVPGAEALLDKVRARAGVDATMGSASILEALPRLGEPRRIALITPHRPLGDERVRAYFTEAGYQVQGLHSFNCETPLEIAHVSRDQLSDAIQALNGPDVDAIVQVGTNLSMARLAAEAEAELGKPVVAINTATYWHALRSCGIEDRFDGWGRLLSDF